MAAGETGATTGLAMDPLPLNEMNAAFINLRRQKMTSKLRRLTLSAMAAAARRGRRAEGH